MGMKEDGVLAIRLASWISRKLSSPTMMETLDTGAILIYYSITHPPVCVHSGGVRWPSGSDQDLVTSFLIGEDW